MERKNETDGFVWIQAEPFLREGLVHAFSTRLDPGGGDRPNHLNLGLHVDDDAKRVLDNRTRLFSALGLDLNASVWARQVHGTHIEQVGRDMRGRGAWSYDRALPGTDAMVSGQTETILAGVFADCVPVFVFDPRTRTIGMVHAGWRGALYDVCGRTVDLLSQTASVYPEDLLVYIGPCISGRCYRVDEPLAARFVRAGHGGRIERTPKGPHLDLRMCVFDALRGRGVPAASITVSEYCTCRDETLFFSHRRDGPTGRMAGIIMNEKEKLTCP